MPDFVEASLGKIIRLRKKLAGAGDAVRSLFRQSAQQDEAVAKLEALRVSFYASCILLCIHLFVLLFTTLVIQLLFLLIQFGSAFAHQACASYPIILYFKQTNNSSKKYFVFHYSE